MAEPVPLGINGLLRDYKLKRGRAMHHFDVLRESVERFTNADRQPVLGEFDEDAGKYLFEVPLERKDPAWSVRLGEFVYNTRASLDYLITALIRSTGEQEHECSEFPIYGIDRISWQDIDQWWEKDPKGRIRRKLKGTPPGTKAALKQLQPFYGMPRIDPSHNPLFALELLSNRDKHRRLNLLIHRAALHLIDAAGKPIYEGPAPETRVTEPDEGDTYTVTLTVYEKPNVDMYLLPSYDIRLHEPPDLIGDLIETLAGINEFIDCGVFPTIMRLLRGAGHSATSQ